MPKGSPKKLAKKALKPAARAKTSAPPHKEHPRPAKPARAKAESARPPEIAAKAAAPKVAARAPAPKFATKAPPERLQPQQNQPAAAVPTDGKPRKNEAGLSTREREYYRDLLLAKRREILGDMSSMETEALRSSGGGSNLSNLPIHMADMGTDNYEQEFTLGLMEKDRKLIHEINVALGKIQNGTYGLCEGTGKPISKARLEAQPWARYSIEYAARWKGI